MSQQIFSFCFLRTYLKSLVFLLFFVQATAGKAQFHDITDTSLLWIGSTHGTGDSMVFWFSGEDTSVNSVTLKKLMAAFKGDTFTVGGMHHTDSGLVYGFFAGDDKVLPMYQWNKSANSKLGQAQQSFMSCINEYTNYWILLMDSVIDEKSIYRSRIRAYVTPISTIHHFRMGNDNRFDADSIITGPMMWLEGLGANYGVLNSSYFFCLNPNSWLYTYFPYSVGISRVVSKTDGSLIYSFADNSYNNFTYGSATGISRFEKTEHKIWVTDKKQLRTTVPADEIQAIILRDMSGRSIALCESLPCTLRSIAGGIYVVELLYGDRSRLKKKILLAD